MKKRALSILVIFMVVAFTGSAWGGMEGTSNTFYGTGAGANTTGDDDYATFIGVNAGYSNTTGTSNTFVGMGAGKENTAGYANTFLGMVAGNANTIGYYNTFIGTSAGRYNTNGYSNTFIGTGAGKENTTGYENVFLGAGAGQHNTTGYWNTFLGLWAGYTNTTGYSNVFLGTGAGQYNTIGYENTFIGAGAGKANTDGYLNTFFGTGAGYVNTTGYSNVFLGAGAGENNTTGYENTFVGIGAGNVSTTGYWNVFLGAGAGVAHDTGDANTFLGTGAGYSHIAGDTNTFLGAGAGYSNTTGMGNVFLGRRAGYNELGSNKLYIDSSETDTPLIYGEFDNRTMTINGNLRVVGPNSGLISLTDVTTDDTIKETGFVLDHYSNAELPVFLVWAASKAGNNILKVGGGNDLGNAATKIMFFTAPNTINKGGKARLTIKGNGNVGIGTKKPSYPLEMASGAHVTTGGVWTDASSREYKDDIEALATKEARETLQGLNPVKFAYKADMTERHVGFIAEEVPDLVATKNRKGLSAMDIVAVLTKVVQEQEKTIQELASEVKELKRELKSREVATGIDSRR